MQHLNSSSEFWALELEWLSNVVDFRIQELSGKVHGQVFDHVFDQAPQIAPAQHPYADKLLDLDFGVEERLVLALALASHLKPQSLDPFLDIRIGSGRAVTQFGGVEQRSGTAFVPSGETALFLLAGPDLGRRMYFNGFFENSHSFFHQHLVSLGEVKSGSPATAGALVPSPELLALAWGKGSFQPQFGPQFPAQLLKTPLVWSDLILNSETSDQLNHLHNWVAFEQDILTKMELETVLQPGYRALFYGPPGTGKTLAASLLGKVLERSVYRVDLGAVVSKYIGETEKNLERVFASAEHRDWILFFDEADALFGKRTSVKDSHDRYANQEVSFLLQRIENYNGLVILASNDKKNIDEAFARRFQSIVHFPVPNAVERLRIWEQKLPEKLRYEGEKPLEFVAKEFELSGGAIVNVVRHVAVRAAVRGDGMLYLEDLLRGIALEYDKVGKFMPAGLLKTVPTS